MVAAAAVNQRVVASPHVSPHVVASLLVAIRVHRRVVIADVDCSAVCDTACIGIAAVHLRAASQHVVVSPLVSRPVVVSRHVNPLVVVSRPAAPTLAAIPAVLLVSAAACSHVCIAGVPHVAAIRAVSRPVVVSRLVVASRPADATEHSLSRHSKRLNSC